MDINNFNYYVYTANSLKTSEIQFIILNIFEYCSSLNYNFLRSHMIFKNNKTSYVIRTDDDKLILKYLIETNLCTINNINLHKFKAKYIKETLEQSTFELILTPNILIQLL